MENVYEDYKILYNFEIDILLSIVLYLINILKFKFLLIYIL